MVWSEGYLGVNRSECFITGVLPVDGWVRGVEATKGRVEYNRRERKREKKVDFIIYYKL